MKKLIWKENFPLFIIILLNIAVKFLILKTTYIPELDHYELCQRRTIVKEIIENKNFEFLRTLNSINLGGGSLVVFLAIPIYLLFGYSPTNFGLVGILFSTATLILLYLFLSKYFNKKVGILASLLFVFSPLSYTLYSITSWGDHEISVFFQVLITLIFFKIFYGKKDSYKNFAILGLVCAFAIWVFYSSLPIVLLCLLFWYVSDKTFFLKKNFLVFLISFLAFSSIGVYYKESLYPNFIAGDLGTFYAIGNQKNIWELNLNFIEKLKDTILYQVPHSFYFDEITHYTEERGIQFLYLFKNSYIYYVISLFSFAYFFILRRKQIFKVFRGILPLKRFDIQMEEIGNETFFIIFLLLYIFIFSIVPLQMFGGPIAHSHRYLIQLYIPLIILMSLFLVSLWNNKTKYKKLTKLLSFLLIFILILISSIANLRFISLKEFGKPDLFYREYCYDFIAERMKEPSECAMFGDNKYYCYESFGDTFMMKSRNLTYAFEECKKLGIPNSEYCYEGVARRLGFFSFGNTITTNHDHIYIFDEDKKEWVGWFSSTKRIVEKYNLTFNPSICEELKQEKYKILCYESLPALWNLLHEPMMCELLNESYKPYCYLGIGRVLFNTKRNVPTYIENNCDALYTGISREIGRIYQDVDQAFKLCDYFSFTFKDEKSSVIFKKYCYEGVGWSIVKRLRDKFDLENRYNLTKVSEYCNTLRNKKECYENVRKFLEKREFLPSYKGCYEMCYDEIKENSVIRSEATICKDTYILNDPELNGAIFITGSNFVIDFNGSNIVNLPNQPPWYEKITNFFGKMTKSCCSTGIKIENATNVTLKNLKVSNFDFGLFVKNSDNITILDSEIDNSRTGIMIAENVSRFKVKNSYFNLTESAIKILNFSDVNLLDSKIFNSKIGMMLEDGAKLRIRGSDFTGINESAIIVTGSNFVVDCDGSNIIGYHPSSITPPWLVGIKVYNVTNVTLRNCVVSNFSINILTENSKNVLIENVTLSDGYFRNFHGKDVKNVTLRNVIAYNAWLDNSIDLSGCCSENITIVDSSIYNSKVGIRAENVNGLKIKNSHFNRINESAIRIENSTHSLILSSTIKNSEIGVMLSNVKNFEIRDSSFNFIANFSILPRNSISGIISNIVVNNSSVGIKGESPEGLEIRNSIFTNSKKGGFIENTTNLTLINVTLSNLSLHGIQIFSSNNILIENSKCYNIGEWKCLLVRDVHNVTIFNSNFTNSATGIEIGNSTNVTLHRSEIDKIGIGIKVKNSNQIFILDTSIRRAEYSIKVENSDDTFLFDVNIKNSGVGIMFENIKRFGINSSSFGFTGNFSIFVRNSENGIIDDTFISNSYNGIKLEYSKTLQIKNSTIKNSNRGGIFENSFNLSLIDINLDNLELHGIQILSSRNIHTESLKCSGVKKWECVLLRNVENGMIFNNSFMNSMVGIEIGNSSNIKVKNNMFFNISEYCIKIPDYNPEKIYLENNFLDPKCKVKM